MGPKLASVPPSLPPDSPLRRLQVTRKGMLCACSLARSIARVDADADDCSPSFLSPFVLPSFLPCSKSGVISEYLSYTHCLALIYNPATRQTDGEASRHHTRQAHTTGHRAPSSVIGDGRKCTKQILPRLPGATQPTRKYVEILEMGLCLRTGGASKRLR